MVGRGRPIDHPTVREALFMEAYLRTFNASESARVAGYKNPGTTGWRVMRRCQEKGFFSKELDKRAMPANEVLARLAEQARGDIGDIVTVNETGAISLDIKDLKERGLSRLIKSVADTKFGIKVEMYDAQAALVQIGRAHGLFIDKTALTDPTGKKPYEQQRPDLSRLSDDELASLADIARRLASAGSGDAEAEPE